MTKSSGNQTISKRDILTIGLSFAICSNAFAAVSACVGEGDCDYFTPSASVTFVTDYYWRGVSQSAHKPTVQGALTLNSQWGPYLGIWASGVNFADNRIPPRTATTEFDVSAGYQHTFLDKWSMDLGGTHYHYPSADGINFNEIYGKLDYACTPILGLGMQLVHTNNWFGTSDRGTYYQANFNADLPQSASYAALKDFSVHGYVGRYHFSGSTMGGRSYNDYNLGVGKKYHEFTLALDFVGTNGGYNGGDLDDGKLLLSIGAQI